MSTFAKSIPVAAAALTMAWMFSSNNAGAKVLPQLANAQWQQECSGCHTLYHPALLPERSWRQVMATLDRHFGDNAALDPATRTAITNFLTANAADRSDAARAQKIAASVGAADTPLRASGTPYMLAKHRVIRADVWKRKAVGSRANCGACHKNADRGDFAEDAVRIPL